MPDSEFEHLSAMHETMQNQVFPALTAGLGIGGIPTIPATQAVQVALQASQLGNTSADSVFQARRLEELKKKPVFGRMVDQASTPKSKWQSAENDHTGFPLPGSIAGYTIPREAPGPHDHFSGQTRFADPFTQENAGGLLPSSVSPSEPDIYNHGGNVSQQPGRPPAQFSLKPEIINHSEDYLDIPQFESSQFEPQEPWAEPQEFVDPTAFQAGIVEALASDESPEIAAFSPRYKRLYDEVDWRRKEIEKLPPEEQEAAWAKVAEGLARREEALDLELAETADRLNPHQSPREADRSTFENTDFSEMPNLSEGQQFRIPRSQDEAYQASLWYLEIMSEAARVLGESVDSTNKYTPEQRRQLMDLSEAYMAISHEMSNSIKDYQRLSFEIGEENLPLLNEDDLGRYRFYKTWKNWHFRYNPEHGLGGFEDGPLEAPFLDPVDLATGGFIGRGAMRILQNPIKRSGSATDDVIHLLDDAGIKHVIKGDKWGSGGHMWSGGLRSFLHGITGRKSMFPPTWSKQKILNTISDIITHPPVNGKDVVTLINHKVVKNKGAIPERWGIMNVGGRKIKVVQIGNRIHSAFPIDSRYYRMMKPVHQKFVDPAIKRWNNLPAWQRKAIGAGAGGLGVWGGVEALRK